MGCRRGMVVLVALLVGAGCGRIGFDPYAEGAPVVAIDDLVAWYEMRSLDVAGNHSVVTDITGHGHDATCTTTCPRVAAGRFGNGFRFDGAQWMAVPAASDLETTTEFTIALWLSVDFAPSGRAHLVTKAFGAQILNSWAIALESDLTTSVFADGATEPHRQYGARTISLGAWHHVAFRWDGSRSDCLIDGVVDSTTTITDIAWDDDAVNLGADFENGAPISFLDGTLDDVRVYRRALTDAEIAELIQ